MTTARRKSTEVLKGKSHKNLERDNDVCTELKIILKQKKEQRVTMDFVGTVLNNNMELLYDCTHFGYEELPQDLKQDYERSVKNLEVMLRSGQKIEPKQLEEENAYQIMRKYRLEMNP